MTTVVSDRRLSRAVAGAWFPLAVIAAVALKLVLVSDLAVLIQYAPQDDGLYVARAFHLLQGAGFGPYDARTLVKLPGMSFWLAGGRLLGLPHLLTMNVLYVLAGCYLVAGALQCGARRPVALIAFVLYLFNPITFGNEWVRVLREPLSTGLTTVLFAAALFILLRLGAGRYPIGHLAVFSAVFAFSRLLREEDALLYAVVVMLGLAAWWVVRRAGTVRTMPMLAAVMSVVLVPLLLGAAANATARAFVERHLGLPLLHDFTEGEFPRLIAAMRSVESNKDNRYVMITQERLAKLLAEVPRLAPVISRLPAPGPGTYSCTRYKVCSEIANGWMPFWIKDAAEQAGLTPDLPAAQRFFRAAREDIEQACREGRLACRPTGQGLLPPFELKWTRAYVQEFLTLLGMTLAPHPHLAATPVESYAVDTNFGRMVQFVTMTHDFDTAQQARGGRSAIPRDTSSLASARLAIGNVYGVVAPLVVLLAVAGFALRVSLWRKIPPDPLGLVLAVFMGYTLLRLAALAYAAVYFGHFDDRLAYATHSFLLLIGPLAIADAVSALRDSSKPGFVHAIGRSSLPA